MSSPVALRAGDKKEASSKKIKTPLVYETPHFLWLNTIQTTGKAMCSFPGVCQAQSRRQLGDTEHEQ